MASENHVHVHWSPDGQQLNSNAHTNGHHHQNTSTNGHPNSSNHGILKERAERASSPTFWQGTLDEIRWPGERTELGKKIEQSFFCQGFDPIHFGDIYHASVLPFSTHI